MEHSVETLKEALTARSQSATLDELRSRGKRNVRVIRADDIAEMIATAVNHAVAESGLMAPDEVEALVAKSREQFRELMQRREREVAELRAATEALDECRAELAQAQVRIAELEQGEATPPNAGMMQYLMSELAELKAKAAAPAAPAAGLGADAVAGALAQFSSAMSQKLENLGKKMGVSAAAEAGAPDLAGLFKHGDEVKLESNMANVSVKAKSGAGISANLERLKKLKGGN